MKSIKARDIEEHLLEDHKPSLYFEQLYKDKKLEEPPLSLIKALKNIEQSPKYHKEGVVWNHTMMVIDYGARYREYANDPRSFMWTLLLHDIGKIKTTKKRNGRWTSYEHDIVGANDAENFLHKLGIEDIEFIEKVKNLVRFHMHHIYILKKLPFGNESEMIKTVDINDMMLVFLCDKLGRGGLSKEDKLEVIAQIHELLEKYKGKGKARFIE